MGRSRRFSWLLLTFALITLTDMEGRAAYMNIDTFVSVLHPRGCGPKAHALVLMLTGQLCTPLTVDEVVQRLREAK